MDISGSPLSNMKIPPEQLYKVHYLDSSKTENAAQNIEEQETEITENKNDKKS